MPEFNPQQQKAVEHSTGPLLIVAGAGSGKTMVVTHRIARMIETGTATPEQILAVTFTNKAANEMKERVRRLVNQDVWISTFHSFCSVLLRRHIDRLGYDRSFVIYDAGDQTTLVKQILKKMNIAPEQMKAPQVINKISRLKDELIDPKTYEGFVNVPYEKTLAKIYVVYQEELSANNALDFSDLIMLTAKLFTVDKEILEHYQNRFHYLMVDEYQDTNYAQYQLVKLLAQKHQNICVVGDPDQSIYSWRGADIRNILDFEKDYGTTTVINLEENYRSTAKILDSANEVIRLNRNRRDKNLRATRTGGENISYYQAYDSRDEADFVVQKVLGLVRSGKNYRDLAVLYRVHALSRSLEEALMAENIPYQIIGGMKFYDRKEIKDLLAYFRFIVNPLDRISLQRIINIPKRGLGPAGLLKVFDAADTKSLTLLEALKTCDSIKGISKATAQKMIHFVNLMEDYARRAAAGEKPSDLLKSLIDATGYEDYLKLDDPATFLSRSENLKELYVAMDEYERRQENPTLAHYLQEVSLITDLDKTDGVSHEFLTLMTIHNAKGLEYPVCFMVGMEEGVFPHASSFSDPDQLEEERRLCYVGITRAKDKLYVSSSLKRLIYGKWANSPLSRFIQDIPPENLTHMNDNTSVTLSSPSTSVSEWEQELQKGDSELGFTVGDRVLHNMWGPGVIHRLEGKDDYAKATVAFQNFPGKKDLLLKYANLSKV